MIHAGTTMNAKVQRVRHALTLVALLSCGGCAALTSMTAREPARPAPAMAAPIETIEEPRKFECSDGTITNSQYDCLIAMARARLPPSDPAK
jgi:hypothetical protein